MVTFYRAWAMRAIGRTVLFNILLFFVAVNLKAQYLNDGNVKYVVQSGIWNLLVNNGSEAERYASILKEHFSSYPVTFILPVLNEMSFSEDCGRRLNKRKIEINLSKAAVVSDSLLEKNPDAENYFYSALTEGVMAYYKYRSGDYVSAFFNGLGALEKFNNCLEKDSSFAAALVAIGTYKYWISEKTRSIGWLPIITDEREEGVRMLKAGLRENNILYHFGLESLIWIYIHQKKFEEAKKISLKALKTFPNSRYFIYALAHCYNNLDKNEANKLFEELIESRNREGCNSNYWRAVLLHKIAMNDFKLKKYVEAKTLCNEILKLNFNDYEKDKLRERLKRVEQLENLIVKKLN